MAAQSAKVKGFELFVANAGFLAFSQIKQADCVRSGVRDVIDHECLSGPNLSRQRLRQQGHGMANHQRHCGALSRCPL